jgi:hypothetical protein
MVVNLELLPKGKNTDWECLRRVAEENTLIKEQRMESAA